MRDWGRGGVETCGRALMSKRHMSYGIRCMIIVRNGNRIYGCISTTLLRLYKTHVMDNSASAISPSQVVTLAYIYLPSQPQAKSAFLLPLHPETLLSHQDPQPHTTLNERYPLLIPPPTLSHPSPFSPILLDPGNQDSAYRPDHSYKKYYILQNTLWSLGTGVRLEKLIRALVANTHYLEGIRGEGLGEEATLSGGVSWGG